MLEIYEYGLNECRTKWSMIRGSELLYVLTDYSITSHIL